MRSSRLAVAFGLAVVLTMSARSRAQEVDGEKVLHFGTEGRWDIIELPGRCFAGTQTSDKTAYLFFELQPKTALVISSHAWDIPSGHYPVAVEHDGVDGSRTSDSLDAEVNPKNHQSMMIKLGNSDEVAKLVRYPWLNFRLGSHEVFFNSDAADATRVLNVCSRKAADPFATVK